MKPGESVTLGDYTYRFDGVEPFRGPNYLAERATFSRHAATASPTPILHPERRQYDSAGNADHRSRDPIQHPRRSSMP